MAASMKYSPSKSKSLIALALLAVANCAAMVVHAEERSEEEKDVRFAFYSAAWGENANEAIRLVAFNNTQSRVKLNFINFQRHRQGDSAVSMVIDLEIPAQRYAEVQLPNIDLLSGDDCVDRTLGDNWKLVEISNYTLNPSVRNLIIENTDSFRIYQCEQAVHTNWMNLDTNQLHEYDEWVLYHFETRPAQ